MSDTKTSHLVAVSCIGDVGVAAPTSDALCLGLRQALVEKYPNTRFELRADLPSKGAAFVTLQTLVSNKSTIEARLTWQAFGAAPTGGPNVRLSISDKELSQNLRLNFITRLVQDTALPF